jgi:predicted P-loop ATPase
MENIYNMITDTKIPAVDLILEHFANEHIMRNAITLSLEKNGEVLTEHDINTIFIELKIINPQSKGLTKQNFDICLNSSFIPIINPLAEFFNSVKKDITPSGYIDQIIDSLVIEPNAELEKLIGTKEVVKRLFTKWITGCVASIYGKNYNCLMFVLIGPKGCGKTEFFRRLLPDKISDYFAQSKFDQGKDSEALMCERLLILNDELDGLHAKEAKTFRNFISANYYTYRPPYGKQNMTRKRLASVCGASNERSIITDAENNRRIIPVEIRGVNHTKYNAVCKRSLFIEAYNLYAKEKFDWNLNAEEMRYLDLLSEKYESPQLEYELIQKFFLTKNDAASIELTASEIKAEIEERTKQRLSLHKIGSNLKRLGFECNMVKRNGKTAQVYSVCPIPAHTTS